MAKLSFKTLYDSVIESELCCFCGTCVSVCPEKCIEFSEKGPELVKSCSECGQCIIACPGYSVPLSMLNDAVFDRKPTENENTVGLGITISDHNLVSADTQIQNSGYTGGKLTALLAYLLEKKKIDGAIVSDCGEWSPYPHFAWPKIATTREELIQCAGSKYMFSPNMMLLDEIAKNDRLSSVAFVGVGCQIQGLRKLAMFGGTYRKLCEKISYVFGLFCGSVMLAPDDVIRLVAKLCQAAPEDIDKIDFRCVPGQAQFTLKYEVTLKNGQKKDRKILANDLFYIITLLNQWYRCRMCMDYSAEFADISFGGVHIISRTITGENLMQQAIADNILVSQNSPERCNFERYAHQTDAFMIRLKKKFNRKRIKGQEKREKPVPKYELNVF